jgi:hypothetical protein
MHKYGPFHWLILIIMSNGRIVNIFAASGCN